MIKVISRVFALANFAVALAGALPSSQAHAQSNPTVISRVTIEYARVLATGGPNGGPGDRLAAIGGKVDFTGPGPVFVSLNIGGQSYSSPTDPSGRYSYLVWANDNQYNVTAWVSASDFKAAVPGTPSISTRATLPEAQIK